MTVLESLFNKKLLSNFNKEISCEYCRIFKITYFQEHLWTAASIRSYFDTIILKQSEKILVSERKYKNNLKNRESQKNK